MKILSLFSLLFWLISNNATGQKAIENTQLDVLSYHVQLKPDINKKFIEGSVVINFLADLTSSEVFFNCGNLEIVDVKGDYVKNYSQRDRKLIIVLNEKIKSAYKIHIFYKGYPSKGVEFFSDTQQMHTVFFTSQWMVCNNTLTDRAKIEIDLTIPDGLICVANGELINKEKAGNLTIYSWVQDYETPTYTFGFAIGPFNEIQEKGNGIFLNYYSHNHSDKELDIIFDNTNDMLKFFEEKSGVTYSQKIYSQILIGNHYQEMSGFAILKNSYAKLVLKDSTETNLISHELAHQWWGNMITCESWNHIWLNEGLATFMSAAYNEHRFGKEVYQANIKSYYNVYQQIKNKNGDRPLIFNNWSNPTKDDRNIAYFKGAYVMHLLRLKLGDKKFWAGIKYYSQQYYGKSVSTRNFQQCMEKSSEMDLKAFFDEWIY